MKKWSGFILVNALFWSASVGAHGHVEADMHHHAHHAKVMPKDEGSTALSLQECWGRFRAEQGPSAFYLNIHNQDPQKTGYVIDVEVTAFENSMLHESYEKDGMMAMRHVDFLEIPAGQTLALKPGAYHIMAFTPEGVKLGDKVDLNLQLNNGQVLNTSCELKPISARSFKE